MSNKVHNLFKGIAEHFTPVLRESQLAERGVVTPDEFVGAGDQLSFRCPSWKWESGDPSCARDYLPREKQFLISRGVPCRERCRNLAGVEEELVEGDDASGWLCTTSRRQDMDPDEFVDISVEPGSADEAAQGLHDLRFSDSVNPAGGESAEDDIPDMDEFNDDNNLVEEDTGTFTAAAPAGASDTNIVRTRTYDVSITYDKYYQTPRFWLFGYSETGQPLSPEQIFEDISWDHARKTVTIESHPHMQGLSFASIHPCRHRDVMQRLIANTMDNGGEFRVEDYMFLFLKFISSIVPTIEYDNTMSAGS